MLAIAELSRSIAFKVDHPRFSPERAYIALALSDDETYGEAEFLFINEAGEPIFVCTEQCIAVEAHRFSTSYPDPYRGRRNGHSPTA